MRKNLSPRSDLGREKKVHIIDGALCIDCGACGRVCPNGDILDGSGKACAPVKRSKWLKPVFNRKLCMSCSICIDACPVHCLVLSGAESVKNTHAYPYLEKEKACLGCGFCADECPVDAITMAVPAPKETKDPAGSAAA